MNTEHETKNQDSSESLKPERDGKIPLTVWQIGVMMLLMNVSFVMAYSFSGLYLKHIIGASTIGIGILEGACEAISNAMKLVSGMLSDFFRRRKGIMICGYAFMTISRPILAISNSFGLVLSARMMERFGNGVQSSPRDAIVADVAPRKKIGASYGLKRSLSYVGSLLGGVFGILAMKLTNNDYQAVFALASVPAFAAISILIFYVKEPKRFDHPAIASPTPMPSPKLKSRFSLANFKYLGTSFWILMGINAVYMTARMNETFLVLHTNDGFKVDPMLAPVVMIFFNFGTALASYPVGILGDRLNRVKILFLGIACLLLADMIMYSAASKTSMYIGIFFWGVQFGVAQNIFISLIAEKVPEDLRGTGIGIYWIINAIASFSADTIAGFVAHHFSLDYIFVSSGLIGLVSLLLLSMLINVISPSAKRI